MKRTKRHVVGIAVAAVIGMQVLSGGVARAHNAGHIIRPDGTCVNVGSQKPGPQVPESNPNRNPTTGELDKYPDTRGDQYGARYAADQGNSEVLPGECP